MKRKLFHHDEKRVLQKDLIKVYHLNYPMSMGEITVKDWGKDHKHSEILEDPLRTWVYGRTTWHLIERWAKKMYILRYDK